MLDEVGEVLGVTDLKLLLRVLIFLHVKAIFDNLVPLYMFLVAWAPELVELAHILF